MPNARMRFREVAIAVMSLSGVALAVDSIVMILEFCSLIGDLSQSQVASFTNSVCFLPLVVSVMLLSIGAASFAAESEAGTIRLVPVHIDGIAARIKAYRQVAIVELVITALLLGASVATLTTMPPNVLVIALLILDVCAFASSVYMLAISKKALQEASPPGLS